MAVEVLLYHPKSSEERYAEARSNFQNWPPDHLLAFLAGMESEKRKKSKLRLFSRIFPVYVCPEERAIRNILIEKIQYDGNYVNDIDKSKCLDRKINEVIAYHERKN